jgi:CBS domain-containing protein
MPDTTGVPTHGSYLLPHFDHATVGDAMHPGILSCDAEASLTEVARMMSTHHVHCIVVEGISRGDSDGSGWGIISDLDLLRAGIGGDAPDTAGELAQRQVVRVPTTSPLRGAAELMLDRDTSHVVAFNPDTNRPVGILSTLDVAGVLAWGEI